MTKITSFRTVPEFTRVGAYEVDFSPPELLAWVDRAVLLDGLQLDPDFQRGHVWTARQQAAFVEFVLRGGRTAKVLYFNKPSWSDPAPTPYDDFVILDGKQRLQAWRQFLTNRIKVFGSYYREFTDRFRGVQGMRVNVNTLPTRAAVLDFYLNFNHAGAHHTPAELRRVRRLLAAEAKPPT